MGHLEIIGYLFAIVIVIYIIARNCDEQKEQ